MTPDKLFRVATMGCLVALLTGTWVISNIVYAVPPFGLGDYPAHSLSHGINIDEWFSGAAARTIDNSQAMSWQQSIKPPVRFLDAISELDRWLPWGRSRNVDYFQAMHPGIPFQLASWVAYRLGSLDVEGGHLQRAAHQLTDPSRFWRAAQVIALILTLLSVLVISWVGDGCDRVYAQASALVFFAYVPTWTFSIAMLGNETFALPLAIAVFALSRRALVEQDAAKIVRFALGFVCGLAYLNKLNYLMWTVAVVVGFVAAWVVRRPRAGWLVASAALVGSGFLSALLLIGGFWLGIRGTLMMFSLHFRTLLHTGMYGGGDWGVVDATGAIAAANRLLTQHPFPLALAVGLVVAAIVVAVRRRQDLAWRRRELPYLVCLVSGVLLCLAATLKHFAPHYLVSGAALLPLIMLALGPELTRRRRLVLSIAVLVAVALSVRSFAAAQARLVEGTEQAARELEVVKALPLGADEVRLWAHGTNVAEYQVNYIDAMIARPDVHELVQGLFSRDLGINPWDGWAVMRGAARVAPGDLPWRYAVFDRQGFSDTASMGGYFRDQAQEILRGARFVVVERAAAPAR